MQRWIDNTAASIEAERARGMAPTTLPAQDLATALNLMNERAMFASFAEDQPAIPEDHVLDTLVHVWITSIYGESHYLSYPRCEHMFVSGAPPSCTLTSIRSTPRSSSVTTPRCAAGR